MSAPACAAQRNSETVYSQSARVYDALHRHKNYAAASLSLRQILQRVVPHATSLLDVACGTGRHLQCFSEHFRVEGLDLSREMLEIARQRCPDVPLHEGTLVDFRLDGRFDVVTCLFGSIGYSRTEEKLQCAVQCMANHLQPGGALVIEPWITPERFVSGKLVYDSVNDSDLRIARMYITRCEGRISVFESDYLIGTVQGVTHFTERLELGLFTDEEYRTAFHQAGLDIVDAASDLFGYGLYVCRAPGATVT